MGITKGRSLLRYVAGAPMHPEHLTPMAHLSLLLSRGLDTRVMSWDVGWPCQNFPDKLEGDTADPGSERDPHLQQPPERPEMYSKPSRTF